MWRFCARPMGFSLDSAYTVSGVQLRAACLAGVHTGPVSLVLWCSAFSGSGCKSDCTRERRRLFALQPQCWQRANRWSVWLDQALTVHARDYKNTTLPQLPPPLPEPHYHCIITASAAAPLRSICFSRPVKASVLLLCLHARQVSHCCMLRLCSCTTWPGHTCTKTTR